MVNGEVSTGTNVTTLPVPQLPEEDTEADIFDNFPHSLTSVGKTSDARTISIFTRDKVTVRRENNVMITCDGKPIMIGPRDMQDRYRILMVQQKGMCQPCKPPKKAREKL